MQHQSIKPAKESPQMNQSSSSRRPKLADHYKPLGIQALNAATVCKPPAKKPAPRGPIPEDS
jgi:hypothetical protein